MAKIGVNSKIATKRPSDFEDAVLDEITSRWSKARVQIRDEVKEQINKSVKKQKNTFIPNREQVGFLGIGRDGSPDERKINNGYRLLEPGIGRGAVANVSVSFQRRASKFGKVRYTVNIDKFYNSDTNIFFAERDSGALTRVKWMENFIKGVAVDGYAFVESSDPDFRAGVQGRSPNLWSRTGLGQMVKVSSKRLTIPRQQFDFAGVGETATFQALLTEIRRRLETRAFRRRVERIIARSA